MKLLNDYKIMLILVGFISAILLYGSGNAHADFTFGTPTNLGPTVNSSYDDSRPSIPADGLSMYFSQHNQSPYRPGGLGGADIWVTTRKTKADPWGSPVNLGPTVNSSSHDFHPWISADGLSLYFCSDRPGGYGVLDIWVATRTTDSDPWSTPVNLGPKINTAYREADIGISSDGLELYVPVYNRPGGYGGWDIWMATRATKDDPWSELVNLGPIINTSTTEGSASLTPDGLTLFFKSRWPHGDSDLYVTKRATTCDAWCPPENLGPKLNTQFEDTYPCVSADGLTLYFASDRPGGYGGQDIWQVKILPLVDLNGDGIVDAADICIMVDHWGTDESLCDIGPMPWGDGVVDVEDLKVLAEHLFEEVEDPTLIAHWPLDEAQGVIAYDNVGNHNATLNGNPVWQPAEGKINGALQFDGIDDYANAGFVLKPSIGPYGAFRAYAWIKGGTPGQVIISQTDGAGFGGTWLGADEVDGKLFTNLMYFELASESVITDDQWYHVGIVWDGSRRYLYVDEEEVARDTNDMSAIESNGDLYLGAGKNLEAGSFFSGLIDDIRIYNVALSAGKIAALAQ